MSDWRNAALFLLWGIVMLGAGAMLGVSKAPSGCECSDKDCECDSEEVIRLLKDIHGHVGHGHGQVGAAP